MAIGYVYCHVAALDLPLGLIEAAHGGSYKPMDAQSGDRKAWKEHAAAHAPCEA